MSQLYANTSAPSTEQLPRLARAASENPNNTIHTQHRRQNSLSGRVGTKVVAKSSSTADLPQNLENQQYDPVALPDRITDAGTSMLPCSSRNLHGRNNDEVGNDESRWRNLPGNSERKEQQQITKDGYLESAIFNSATSGMRSYDEPDHFQHSLARHCHSAIFNTRHAPNNNSVLDNSLSDIAISSDISSTESSACPSTVSSPLSTPTRLSPQHELYHPRSNNHQVHQEQPQSTCCQNSIASVNASSPSSSFATSPHNNSQHNYHNHLPEHPNHQQPNTTSSVDTTVVSGNKNFKKFYLRWILLYYRQILPVALCVLSFATVFSILIVYMDTTEIRHQQFRLNMSRDYDLYSVAQDDPQLIAFLREIHMRKYPSHVFRSSPATDDNGLPGGGGIGVGANGNAQSGRTPASYLNLSASPDELTPKMAYYVANVMQGKTTGAVIQSLTGPLGHLLTAPWLAETLNWAGMVVEPEPRRYFTLRKENALQPQLQIIHACVSPNPYPKEVTIHNEEAEVRINSLLDEETSWFNSRVKCFPLYTIMLALNRIEYDLLSLGVHGHELEILQTLPFEKIKIELISIHLLENQEDMSNYIQAITKFLVDKSYKMQKKFGRNYFYQRVTAKTPSNKTQTRIRKKKILIKTP